jgi:hypothetical protein
MKKEPKPPRITLHDEINNILASSDERSLTASEISERVNQRGKYRKKDGSPMRSSQILLRVRHHTDTFEAIGQDVRLIGARRSWLDSAVRLIRSIFNR